MKAQKGILSYWKSDLIKEENIFTQQVERIPLDDLLYESGPDNEIALYEIKLTITEAHKLFTFTNKKEYMTLSIFPG